MKMYMLPRVAMIGGTRALAQITPFTKPSSAATPMPIGTTTTSGSPAW